MDLLSPPVETGDNYNFLPKIHLKLLLLIASFQNKTKKISNFVLKMHQIRHMNFWKTFNLPSI